MFEAGRTRCEIRDNLTVVRKVLVQKREDPESENNWKWMDFLEIHILSELSNLSEFVFRGIPLEDLPQPAKVEWKNPQKETEFDKLWIEFLTASSRQSIRIKLERMFILWSKNAEVFPLKADGIMECENYETNKEHLLAASQ